MLAVFVSLMFAAPKNSVAQAINGVWKIKANGYSGELIVKSDKDGQIEGTLFGDKVNGSYDRKTRCLTLSRLRNGALYQSYKGYTFLHADDIEDTHAIAGIFQDFSGDKASEHEYGWFAHLVAPVTVQPEIRLPLQKPPKLMQIGKKFPFLIENFLTGPQPEEGCPSVMISNSRAKGIIIWSRGADEAIINLAKEMDAKYIDYVKTQGYLVIFNDADMKTRLKKAAFSKLMAGKSTRAIEEVYKFAGVSSDTDYVIALINEREITSLWEMKKGELSEEKRQSIVKTAGELLK